MTLLAVMGLILVLSGAFLRPFARRSLGPAGRRIAPDTPAHLTPPLSSGHKLVSRLEVMANCSLFFETAAA